MTTYELTEANTMSQEQYEQYVESLSEIEVSEPIIYVIDED